MEEEWKEIYDGNYSVSNTGKVKANDRIIETKTGPSHYKERILKPETTRDGHKRVALCNAGKKSRVFVHRLVAQTFIPNPNNYPIINHKDEDPGNNNMNNLEWCTVSYNVRYNGLSKRIGDAEGINVHVFLDGDDYVESFPSVVKAAKAYGLNVSTAYNRLKDGKLIDGLYYFTTQ